MRFSGALLVLILTLCGTGCQAGAVDDAAPGPAGWPESLASVTMVWTADPGIDLLSAPAVPVRAYLESFILVALTGEKRFLYPGFLAAVDEPLRPGGLTNPHLDVGTITNHLLSIGRSGDGIAVTGCTYTYALGATAPGPGIAPLGSMG